LAKAGDIFGGETQPQLMGSAVSADQLQLGVPQLGIDLQNGDSILRSIPRIHLATPDKFSLKNCRGKGPN
jgi:hypothetical protein